METEVKNTIKEYAKLGREIKISPKTLVSINNPGYKKEYFTHTVEVIIGIGKNNTASILMDIDTWEALKNGDEILTTKIKDFKGRVN